MRSETINYMDTERKGTLPMNPRFRVDSSLENNRTIVHYVKHYKYEKKYISWLFSITLFNK